MKTFKDFNSSISINETNFESIDYSEHLGDLNLRAIRYKKNKIKKCRPFEPDSTFKTTWDLTGMVLIMYESIDIPYRVGFSIPITGWFTFLSFFVDCFFLSDIGKFYYIINN